MQGRADSKSSPAFFSWTALSNISKNVTGQTIDYETFKAQFDADPSLQSIIDRFDAKGIVIKTKNKQDIGRTNPETGGSTVDSSAKRAAAKIVNR